MGGNRIDPYRFRQPAVLIENLLVTAFLDRLAQFDRIKPDLGPDTHEIIDILELAGQLPVRFEKRAVHLLELAVLARKLRSSQRLSRVDQHIALLHDKTHLVGDVIEAASHLLRARASEISLAGGPFDWRFRMQLVREPGQVNKTLLLQLFDSDRVDVAPGSNVVGEDDQIRGRRICTHPDQPTGVTRSRLDRQSRMLASVFVRFDQRTILRLEQHVDAGDDWRIKEGACDLGQGLIGHLPAASRARDGRSAAA